MGYGLTDLQKIVRYSARNAGDSTLYVPERIDYAIQDAMDEWIRLTKATRVLNTSPLTAGSNAVPTLPDGFTPERLLQAYLTLSGSYITPDLSVVSYDELLRDQYTDSYDASTNTPASGQPTKIAFSTQTAAIVGPYIPDQAYTLNLWWYQPRTSWTAGTDATTVTAFNLPDDHLMAICKYGAPASLQEGEPENAQAAAIKRQKFLALAKEFASLGSGSRGTQVITRARPDWDRRCER